MIYDSLIIIDLRATDYMTAVILIGLRANILTKILVNDNDNETEEDKLMEQEDGEDYNDFIPVQTKRRGCPKNQRG